jgi:glycerol uptake operon antiterminator
MTALAVSRPASLVERIVARPCCAAITGPGQLDAALASRVPVVFVLRGNGLELAPTIDRIHAAGKLAAAHLDLVDGLHADHRGVSWLVGSGADAVITSHGQLIPVIRAEGAVAIQRLLLSSRSHLDTAIGAISRAAPDVVEILPGVILPAVTSLLPAFDAPILAGGFVRTRADARSVLAAGAIGLTTSARDLWDWEPTA